MISFAGLANANGDTISTPNQLDLPPIGIGAWAWGDSIFWGYDHKLSNLFARKRKFNRTIDIIFLGLRLGG
jgi:hypothetical protein